MERLTKQWGDNPAVPANINYDFLLGLDKETADGVQAVLDRLAAYEDTGLEPVEVKEQESAYFELMTRTYGSFCQKIGSWRQAEKDGRLAVLPCKVGDTVWTNFAMSGWYFRGKDKPYSARVAFVGLNDSDKMGSGLINVVYGKHDHMMQFSFSEIGKTVFLTREEAEAALKKEAESETHNSL